MYTQDEEQLRKYLQGELDPQESESIRNQLAADPAARKHVEEMQKIWQLSGNIHVFKSVDPENGWKEWKDKLAAAAVENQLPARPSTNYAWRFLRVAALVLLISLSAAMIYHYTGMGGMISGDWVTHDSGETMDELSLPDGSKVFLNAGSSLQYPTEFEGRKRRVKLEGEGFFEVARNEKSPFIIEAGDNVVAEVLGTSFNLRTDPKSKKVFLNVLTGKVAFYPKGKKKEASILEQNEQAMYHSGGIVQSHEIDLNFLSWKTRTLEFENTSLPDVMEQLGRHYKKEIRIADAGLDSLALTGTFEDQTMEEVLEEIEMVLEIKFREVDGILQVSLKM